MISKEEVNKKLREVLDPELKVNIVDLGLVYNVATKDQDVSILMTLTFPGCPLGSIIHNEIKEKVGSIPKIGKINLKITFDPPWSLDKISPDAKAELGILN